MAADWGLLLLDFHWRPQTEPLADLLDRLAAQPPDRLIIMAHGFYQAMSAEDVLRLRSGLPRLVSRLEVLTVQTLWACWRREPVDTTNCSGPMTW